MTLSIILARLSRVFGNDGLGIAVSICLVEHQSAAGEASLSNSLAPRRILPNA